MMLQRHFAILATNASIVAFVITSVLGGSLGAEPALEAQSPETHPLMPGIRMRQLWDRDWPRTLHDRYATGFSPLVCGMSEAPEVWWEIEVGGTVGWTKLIHFPSDEDRLLVSDGRLRLIDVAGNVLWTRGSPGALLYQGDLQSDGGHYLLMGGGPRLAVLDAETGDTLWQHQFEPKYVGVRVRVADILRDLPGQEAAVFFNYGTEGCVINFPPEGDPRIVWQREVTIPDEFNERYDHRCDIELDLSDPDMPLIWNVRRFRCRGYDARTGEMVSTLAYEIGGAPRRNYGPWSLGQSAEGQLLACVVGEQVQTHVHAIRLQRSGENELAWQHYYGEVYKKAPGVAVKSLVNADIDGDGATEMVYTVRDPESDYQSFVRIRDAATGTVEFELEDHWGAGTFSGVGKEQAAGLLVYEAPDGATPNQGVLKIFRFVADSVPQLIGSLSRARLWGGVSIETPQGRQLPFPDRSEQSKDLLHIRERTEDGQEVLSRYDIVDGELKLADRTDAAGLLGGPIHAVLPNPSGEDLFINSNPEGQLQAWTWSGVRQWQHPLLGGGAATVSAADLDQNGKAELLVRTPAQRMRVYSFDENSNPREVANYQHIVGSMKHNPVAYDLEGNGNKCILAPGSDSEGMFAVRAYRHDGSLLWETSLDFGATEPNSCIINAGQFLAADHAGVAVSVTDSRLVREGTYLLDGITGKLLWFKGRHRDGYVIFPYRPHSVATAHDVDGDGTEEIGMDLLCYMAHLRGSDGSFASIYYTHNIKAEGALFAGELYNSYCPIFQTADDTRPHWTVTTGFGDFGLMKPDPREGVWREDLQYDTPMNIAMIDVDGDAAMEVGYAARNDATFVCRDLWTGEIEWELELPHPPNSLTITADVDGDGKGEFLTGSFCIGANDAGEGELRWQSPVSLSNAIMADFDGDGDGEIVCALPGKVVALNASDAKE